MIGALCPGAAFAADAIPAGKIVNIRGNVEVSTQADVWTPVKAGQLLWPGNTIQTGANGWAAVLLSDETLVQLNRNSRFTLTEVAPKSGWQRLAGIIPVRQMVATSWYKLEKGEGWFRNKNKDIQIRIDTPTAVVGIRGTELDIKIAPDQSGTLTVLEGSLQVRNDLGALDVREGEQVLARASLPLAKRLILNPEDAVQWTIPLPPLFYEQRMPDRLRQAHADLTAGELSKAVEELTRVIESHPGDDGAWSLLSLTQLMLGRKADALASARRATQLQPESSNAHLILAYAHQAAFDLDLALPATRKALALDGGNVSALVNLARLRFGMDDPEEALDAAQQAMKIAPLQGETHNLLGFVLLARRQVDQAIVSFNRARELDPSLGEPHMGLALAYMRKGNTLQAMEEITTAALLEPRRALFLSYWGKMLHQIERFDKALEVLAFAAKLDTRDPTPEFYSAVILRDLNRPTEAINAINRAVALNDNRAVYRSRFLLDRDLASRNIDLSLLYNQLGLSAWARNKAMASVKQDYGNAGGHLFLSGALRDADDRSWAFAGESLLARLLQPANVNTFNTFNEYTSFFEKPAINGTITGLVGENKTGSGEIIVDGAVPALNLALAAGGAYQETDGWRDSNGERVGNFVAYGKWDPTMNDGVMAVFSRQQWKQKDLGYPRYEWDAPQEPDAWTENRLTRVELGYHHHFSPRSDLLLHYSRMSSKTDIYDLKSFSQDLAGLPPMTAIGKTLFSGWNETPYQQLQGQLLFKAGTHQLILGSVQYWGDNDLDGVSSADVNKIISLGTVTDVSINVYRNTILNETRRRSESYYLQDIWRISRYWSVEAALYFDRMENGDPLYNTAWTLNEWNPRLGLIFTPTDQDTFRLAAFRYLLPYITSRIDPMDIGGIPVLRNNFQGSVIREGNLTWEREWRSGFLSLGGFYLEKEYTHQLVDATAATVEQQDHGRMKGAAIALNQLLWQGVGLAASYRYQNVQDDSLPEANREDHLVVAGLKYVHALGFSAALSETYRHSRFQAISRNDEEIWFTDAKIGYEFPKKRGSINLECRNVFNQHFNWVTDYFVFNGRVPTREAILTLSFNF
jgi:tetratricopeptide (TPR) repeat protein